MNAIAAKRLGYQVQNCNPAMKLSIEVIDLEELQVLDGMLANQGARN